LQFDNVCTILRGRRYHSAGQLNVSVVIESYLGDDEGRLVRAEGFTAKCGSTFIIHKFIPVGSYTKGTKGWMDKKSRIITASVSIFTVLLYTT